MKRKIDLVEEEHESEHEESESSGDESEDEEPRIKDVLSPLSQAVSEKRASDLLHSMAASKDILFWAPRGQLLRGKRIIPVTNIAELVEYVLVPHNNEVTKPRALDTFLDGLAELGIDKGLIKNKKLLSDLIEKEKGYQNAENTSENQSNNEESWADIENREEEVASENGSEAESSVVYGGIRTFPMFWVYKRYLTLGCGDHAHLTLTLGKTTTPKSRFS